MSGQTRSLRDSARVVLDGAGAGSIRFGPGRPNTKWKITRISVSASPHVAEPEARIYRGPAGDASFISGTFVGSSDSDDAVDQELFPGEFLTVLWTGGDPGAIATATWSGDEITGA